MQNAEISSVEMMGFFRERLFVEIEDFTGGGHLGVMRWGTWKR